VNRTSRAEQVRTGPTHAWLAPPQA